MHISHNPNFCSSRIGTDTLLKAYCDKSKTNSLFLALYDTDADFQLAIASTHGYPRYWPYLNIVSSTGS
jgi:hypothetical protein